MDNEHNPAFGQAAHNAPDRLESNEPLGLAVADYRESLPTDKPMFVLKDIDRLAGYLKATFGVYAYGKDVKDYPTMSVSQYKPHDSTHACHHSVPIGTNVCSSWCVDKIDRKLGLVRFRNGCVMRVGQQMFLTKEGADNAVSQKA